jgi:hypothetical protein
MKGVELGPHLHQGWIHGKDSAGSPALDPLVPAFDLGATSPRIQEMDALEDFPQGDHADVELGVVIRHPLQDMWVNPWLG